MNDHLPKNPLQGITLEQLLIKLANKIDWLEGSS
ncbi:MAG: DNA-binding protein [Pseudomonadota bacterium]